MIFDFPTPQNLIKIVKKCKKLRQDSDEHFKKDQRPAKVRSKTVPEAHLEAQNALDDH